MIHAAFRAFLGALPEPGVLATPAGEVRDLNAAAARLLGVARAEAAGRPLASLLADPPARVEAYVAACARSGSLLPGSLTPRGPDGPGERIRAEGCALRLDGTGTVEAVLLRLHPGQSPSERFLALNQGIEALTREAHQRRRAEEALRTSERRAAFLARASHELATSLDLEVTLASVARLAVPEVADWCAVDLLQPDGTLRRVAVEHPDPEKVRLAIRLQERYPPDMDGPRGVPHVLRTGEPDFMAEIPEELLARLARDEEHLRIIRELRLRSFVVAPLRSTGAVLGAMTFVYAESGRTYTEGDRDLLADLARRAAVAIENARLVRGIEEAHEQIQEQAVELETQAEELQAQTAQLEEQAVELEISNHELEQARAEAERRADENQLLLDSTGEGIYGMDEEGRCTFLNRAAARMLGYEPGECLGRNMHQLVHGHRPDGAPFPEAECPIYRALRTGQGVHVEEDVLWRRDGTPLWVRLSSYPIRRDGRLSGAVVAFSDVTARREGERAAREARAEAERANRAKSEFLAAMSHELRTPLNAIAGHLDIVDMGIHGPVTDEQRKALGRVKANQEHLLGLINDILQFAKLEAGKIEYQVADLPVQGLVSGVMEMLEPQARARELAFECGECDPALALRGDRDRVQQILINLLGNAIKFTEPGGRIALSCRVEGPAVLIAVEDTGVGIAPEKLASVFDPFVQAGRHDEERRHGVGLGLAISRDLARAMGGDLSVQSEPGRGSTFTVSLPLAGAGRPDTPQPVTA